MSAIDLFILLILDYIKILIKWFPDLVSADDTAFLRLIMYELFGNVMEFFGNIFSK